MNVNCLIVCQAELPKELRELPTTTCIIATPFDAFKASRMIYHAIEAGASAGRRIWTRSI